jgi:methionyl-tRNA synthetase
MVSKKSFYVTTPIYYVTAKPHLGSLYTTLMADVVARWQKLCNKQLFFLTGTDEHGQKIAQAAQQAGQEPKAFVDSFIADYINTWRIYQIDYTKFIRTTDQTHVQAAQSLVAQLIEQGDIYKDIYQGWYCTPCETFVTNKDITPQSQQVACPSCGRPTTLISEETYFFRLSAYQDKLLAFYQSNPDFIVPLERTHEVTSFVESGLKDLSVSRTTVAWGVPFPHDPQHTIYVWVEALANYISAIGYAQPGHEKEFAQWWPANLHILGKDIVRFHAVYWPALLMAAGLPLPKRLLVHGWIKVNKQKMSKSLGNVVDPIELQKTYGVDAVRYYLLRYIPINQDGEFSTADLERVIDNDLANDLSNLLNRMLSLAYQHELQVLLSPDPWSSAASALRDECCVMIRELDAYMADYQFHMALSRIWHTIKMINAYFHGQEPWKQVKSDRLVCMHTLAATAHSLRVVAMVLHPFMPRTMEDLLMALGVPRPQDGNSIERLQQDEWQGSFTLTKIPYLFERRKTETSVEQKPDASAVVTVQDTYISIDEFKKAELVVGTIQDCQAIAESEKLLKLQVDFGDRGIRQVLSGLKKFYAPHELIGKQVVFIFNLQPRKMMGYDSQGMLLTASDPDGKPQLITPAAGVTNGARLQ